MRTILESSIFSGAQFISTALATVASFITRALVPAAAFGSLSFSQAISGPMNAYNGAIRMPIEREFVRERSMGRFDDARDLLGTIYFTAVASLILESLMFVVMGLLVQDRLLAWGLWTMAGLNLLDGLAASDALAVKAHMRFRSAATGHLFAGAWRASSLIGLSFLLGTPGYFIGLLAGTLGTFVIFRFTLGFDPLRRRISLARFGLARKLIVASLSLVLFRGLQSLLLVADRFIIAGHLSLTDLGYYSLATAVVGAVQLLPNTLTGSYYPRLVGNLARGGPDAVRGGLRKLHGSIVVVSAVAFAFAAALLVPLVTRLLPEYAVALPVIQLMIVTGYVAAADNALQVLAVGTDRLRAPNAFAGVAIGAVIVLGLLLVGPFGLMGVASAALIGLVLYTVALTAYAQQLVDGRWFLTWEVVGLVALLPAVVLSTTVGFLAGAGYALALAAAGGIVLVRIHRLDRESFAELLQVWKRVK